MMRVDALFLTSGVIALTAMILRIWYAHRRSEKPTSLEVGLWLAFIVGLLIQGLFASFAVVDGHFVIPFEEMRRTPAELIMEVRVRQTVATVLTLIGGAGLLYRHRAVLSMR